MGETGTPDAVVFLTHFHWDHIQGFPFFLPLYDPEASLRIVGPDQADADIEKLFASQMASINFRVPYAALLAEKEFSNLNGGAWEEDGFCPPGDAHEAFVVHGWTPNRIWRRFAGIHAGQRTGQ